jgi:hypothetical protein
MNQFTDNASTRKTPETPKSVFDLGRKTFVERVGGHDILTDRRGPPAEGTRPTLSCNSVGGIHCGASPGRRCLSPFRRCDQFCRMLTKAKRCPRERFPPILRFMFLQTTGLRYIHRILCIRANSFDLPHSVCCAASSVSNRQSKSAIWCVTSIQTFLRKGTLHFMRVRLPPAPEA